MGVNGVKQLPLHVAWLTTNVVLLMILGLFLVFFVNSPHLIVLIFCLSYVVLFPKRLSPKLPVLTLDLANSSASKQKKGIEPGIFMLKSYCLLETPLAMSSLNCHCHNYFANYRNCRNCQ